MVDDDDFKPGDVVLGADRWAYQKSDMSPLWFVVGDERGMKFEHIPKPVVRLVREKS